MYSGKCYALKSHEFCNDFVHTLHSKICKLRKTYKGEEQMSATSKKRDIKDGFLIFTTICVTFETKQSGHKFPLLAQGVIHLNTLFHVCPTHVI